MTTRRITVTAAALVLASLGACSRSQPDEAPAADAGSNADMEAADTPPPPTTPDAPVSSAGAAAADANAAAARPPAATNASADLPPAAPVDHQMMDDASATGMTARSSRGERSSDDQPTAGQTETR